MVTCNKQGSASLLRASEKYIEPISHRWLMKKKFWNFLTDTWIPEITAAVLSMSCSVAIGILLATWSGQQVPQLSRGITVNAIISVLATTSKSAMLYLVSTCIAQTKWIWFRRARPLAQVQVFDDASRGPLGAMYLLTDSTILSAASLGAIIAILSLAFDPFVQQALVLPLQPVAVPSSNVLAKKALAAFSEFHYSSYLSASQLEKILSQALWNNNFVPPFNCPSNNCTWPNYKSLSICHQCQQMPPVVDQPITFELILQDMKRRGLQDSNITFHDSDEIFYNWNTPLAIKYNATLSDVGPLNIPLGYIFGYELSNTTEYLYSDLLQDLVWLVTDTSYFADPGYLAGPTFYSDTPRVEVLDLKDPIIAIAFSRLAWSEEGVNMDNTTLCALDFCLREYELSVVEDKLQIKYGDPVYGTKDIETINNPAKEQSLTRVCWRPLDVRDVQYQWYHPRPESEGCPYDQHTFAFCACDEIAGEFDWLNVFDGIQGNSKFSATLSYIKRDGFYEIKMSVFSDDDIVGDTSTTEGGNLEYSSSGFDHLVNDLGPENFTTNLAAALTNLLQERAFSNTTGYTVSMLPQVHVRWTWLILPALLNLAAATFLALTIWTTNKHKMPLWKTSLVATFFYGVKQNAYETSGEMVVSSMHEAAEHLNVCLRRSDTADKMVFHKED